jgi:outer membrane immunogenic protein
MRSFTLAAVAAAGIALGAVQTASAADIARPVYKAAPVIAAYNWSGFYIGGNVGYGWGDLNGSAFGLEGSGDIDGWFAGGQIGWNWQAPGSPWVWGVEVDSQWAGIGNDLIASTLNGPAAFSVWSSLDYFGTARLRLGYAWDRVMFYGTGGLAWGNNEIGGSLRLGGATAAGTFSNSHVGWTVGAGFEWALVDNWTAKVEYLFIDLDNENYFSNAFNGLGFDANLDVHTVKVGLNYRFGYSKAPVVAKY